MNFHLQIGGGKSRLRARVDDVATGHDLVQVVSSLQQFVGGLQATLQQVAADAPEEYKTDIDTLSEYVDGYRFPDGFKYVEDAD